MSALPTDPGPIADQDRTHDRIRQLLGEVTAAVLAEQPSLLTFGDHRPERDRPSGGAWRGLETMCHVSALLTSHRGPEPGTDGTRRLLEAAHRACRSRGLERQAEREGHALHEMTWVSGEGDLLEMVVGVRVALRAISAPFLPGSLDPVTTTSPPSPISPLTPPPRPLR